METQGIQTRIPEDFAQVLATLLVLQLDVFEKVLFEQHFVHNNAWITKHGITQRWGQRTKKYPPKRELLVNNCT